MEANREKEKMIKKFIVDNKPVLVFNNKKNIPSRSVIQKTYRKIPDNKNIPIMFMTRQQYLNLYLKNQEKQNGTRFNTQERKEYIREEMPVYRNIIGRYTTNHNPYFPPAVVFFNDKKITSKQFQRTVFHEYGHEYAERHNLHPQNEEKFSDGFIHRRPRRK